MDETADSDTGGTDADRVDDSTEIELSVHTGAYAEAVKSLLDGDGFTRKYVEMETEASEDPVIKSESVVVLGTESMAIEALAKDRAIVDRCQRIVELAGELGTVDEE